MVVIREYMVKVEGGGAVWMAINKSLICDAHLYNQSVKSSF